MAEKEKRRIVAYAQVGMAKIEYPSALPDDWDEMTEEDRQEYLDQAAETMLQNHVNFGAYVEEGE